MRAHIRVFAIAAFWGFLAYGLMHGLHHVGKLLGAPY